MDKFYLQWSAVNWLTVLLMVGVGGAAIGVVVAGFRSYTGAGE